jgi:hypothetical protein
MSLSRLARVSKPMFRRNFSSLMIDYESIYIAGMCGTFYLILIPNLYMGTKLIYRNVKSKDYDIGDIIGISCLKSCVYSCFWPIFIPYAFSRPFLMKYVPCTIDIENNYNLTHNFNGFIRHFIPMYYNVVIHDSKSVRDLQEENKYFVTLKDKGNVVLAYFWKFMKIILDKIF